jgi:Lar family restriction alleviation protein
MHVKPCPFCGSENIEVEEGSTFRWRYAVCLDCDARAGEIRIQTAGAGHVHDWENTARINAFMEWNKRA